MLLFPKPATLHGCKYNMARELIEQGVQAKALRIGDSNKRKWEDQQGNNHHQQQNRRQEAAKVYVAAPAKVEATLGTYHGAIGARHIISQNVTCFCCGNQRAPTWMIAPEFKEPKLRYQVKGTEARGMVHALVGGETNQNLNNMEDDINA
ncbi:hypothetical protein Tco_0010786 [Tanacetum coccineum]